MVVQSLSRTLCNHVRLSYKIVYMSASALVRIATQKLTSFLVYCSTYIPVTLPSLQDLNSPTYLETYVHNSRLGVMRMKMKVVMSP